MYPYPSLPRSPTNHKAHWQAEQAPGDGGRGYRPGLAGDRSTCEGGLPYGVARADEEGGGQGPGDIAVPYTHVVVSYPAASWRRITNARDFRAIPGPALRVPCLPFRIWKGETRNRDRGGGKGKYKARLGGGLEDERRDGDMERGGRVNWRASDEGLEESWRGTRG